MRHYFFKVLLGDFSKELMIPLNFLKYLSANEAEFRVENSRGRSWRVEVRRTEEGRVFLTGSDWTNFVKENRLRELEFLVFGYDGKKRMRVKIFDTSACERRPEDTQHVKDEEKERKKRGRPLGSLGRRKKIAAVDVNDAADICVPDRCVSEVGKAEATENKTIKMDEDMPLKKMFELCRQEPCDEAKLFGSNHPYFTTCIEGSNVDKPLALHIPSEFAQDHLPLIKTQMVLRDPEERAWIVAYNPDSKRIIAGWPTVTLANNLKSGDICAFELIGRLELRMHVLSKGIEPSSQI